MQTSQQGSSLSRYPATRGNERTQNLFISPTYQICLNVKQFPRSFKQYLCCQNAANRAMIFLSLPLPALVTIRVFQNESPQSEPDQVAGNYLFLGNIPGKSPRIFQIQVKKKQKNEKISGRYAVLLRHRHSRGMTTLHRWTILDWSSVDRQSCVVCVSCRLSCAAYVISCRQTGDICKQQQNTLRITMCV